MVCGPNEPYLGAVLKQFKRLKLDYVQVVGNNIDEESAALIVQYGFDLVVDNRVWGQFQPKIKEDLLKRIALKSPDWIVAVDADEIFDVSVTRKSLEDLANRGGIAWQFYIVNYWNDVHHYAKGLSFWNVRFFKLTPEYGLDFINKPVHCGLAPPMQYRYANDSPYILWHYGLMDKEKRRKKVERYKQFDPNAVYKSDIYYNALADETPPARLVKSEMRQKVLTDVTNRKMKTTPVVDAAEGYVYLKKGERTIDVPKKDQHTYERLGWEFVSDINVSTNVGAKVHPPIIRK